MADEQTPAVEAMLNAEVNAATAPLWEFVEAYRGNDNLWWYLACGHHQNLFEGAVERLEDVLDECVRNDLLAKRVGGGFVTTARLREIIGGDQ